MVTLGVPQRQAFAEASIAAYLRQSHPRKELVMVVDERGDAADRLGDHVRALGRDDIRIVASPAGRTLGELRTLSHELAVGEVVCQWDDDDLHHPDRVGAQLAALEAADGEANYLQDVMQFFPAERALYWTCWRATPSAGHPGTLMARRSAPLPYPHRGSTSALGEDSVVALALMARGGVGYLAGQAHLFVYVSHGENSWHSVHHRMLANELTISDGLLRRREAQVRDGLAPIDLGAAPVAVRGPGGVAFTLER